MTDETQNKPNLADRVFGVYPDKGTALTSIATGVLGACILGGPVGLLGGLAIGALAPGTARLTGKVVSTTARAAHEFMKESGGYKVALKGVANKYGIKMGPSDEDVEKARQEAFSRAYDKARFETFAELFPQMMAFASQGARNAGFYQSPFSQGPFYQGPGWQAQPDPNS